MKPNLGDAVMFNATLERIRIYDGPVQWIAKPHTPRYGVNVGYRTVYEGRHMPGGPDYQGYVKVERGIYHALVAVHPHKAFLRVPLEGIL